MKKHLREKRNELIWAISVQDYNNAEIGKLFNLDRATILRIIGKRPYRYKPKWEKVRE